MFALQASQGAAKPALLCPDRALRMAVNYDRLLAALAGQIFCSACRYLIVCNARQRVCHWAFRGWGMRWRQLCSKLRILVGISFCYFGIVGGLGLGYLLIVKVKIKELKFKLLARCRLFTLLKHCRWLTDSNSLFCLQQQKSKQKNAAPLIKLSLKA